MTPAPSMDAVNTNRSMEAGKLSSASWKSPPLACFTLLQGLVGWLKKIM